uniref:Uncharacterized protein n=1 Tax=Zea mays TaxID=4577 RepID=A0A804NM66_MAIZE
MQHHSSELFVNGVVEIRIYTDAYLESRPAWTLSGLPSFATAVETAIMSLIRDDGIEVTSKFVDCSNLTNKGKTVDKGTPGESNDNKPNLGKRKRFMTDEDVAVFNGMKQAVSDVVAAVRESIHAEAAPRIYSVVINCPGFSREALMYALNHMMEHKATSLVFLYMTPDDRDLWLKTFLAKHYHNLCDLICLEQ